MNLPKQKALDILDGEIGEIISDEVVDTRRWSVIHKIVIKLEDKFYQTHYSVGATENQDEEPWEYVDEVTFLEVIPVETIVTKYVPVKQSI